MKELKKNKNEECGVWNVDLFLHNIMAKFEKLEIWKDSVDFGVRIFQLTKGFSIDLKKSIGDQIQRSSLSISSNIAEGSGCETTKEEVKYLRIAISSAYECLSQLYFCKKLDLLTNDQLIENLTVLIRRLKKYRSVKSTHHEK